MRQLALSSFSTFVTESGNHCYFVMSCTEDVLDKLNKKELIGILILEEIRKLNDKFSQLESEKCSYKASEFFII